MTNNNNNSNKGKFEKNPDEIGAIWKKISKSGSVFYSGYVEVNGEKVQLVLFPSSKEEDDRIPAFRILKSKEFNPSGAGQGQAAKSKPAPAAKPKAQAQPQEEEDDLF